MIFIENLYGKLFGTIFEPKILNVFSSLVVNL